MSRISHARDHTKYEVGQVSKSGAPSGILLSRYLSGGRSPASKISCASNNLGVSALLSDVVADTSIPCCSFPAVHVLLLSNNMVCCSRPCGAFSRQRRGRQRRVEGLEGRGGGGKKVHGLENERGRVCVLDVRRDMVWDLSGGSASVCDPACVRVKTVQSIRDLSARLS